MADIQVTADEIAAITNEDVIARKELLSGMGMSNDHITKEFIAKERKIVKQINADITKIQTTAGIDRARAAEVFHMVNFNSPTRVADAIAIINKNKGVTGGKRRYRKSTRCSKKRRSTRRRQ